jgi:hypothetical protein
MPHRDMAIVVFLAYDGHAMVGPACAAWQNCY